MPQSKNRPPRSDSGPGGVGGVQYARAYQDIDFRRYPLLYRIGTGEQGVLMAEPFKSELLPLWRIKGQQVAAQSADALASKFVSYSRDFVPNSDPQFFVGMDMVRKFLQMGLTRSRRYANHRGGRKWLDGQELPRVQPGEDETCDAYAAGAREFADRLDLVKTNPVYEKVTDVWLEIFGRSPLPLAQELTDSVSLEELYAYAEAQWRSAF